MGRQDTESADVSAEDEGAEILVVARIYPSNGPIATAPCFPGVVCRINGAENGGYPEIEVGLDKSRWRQIPAGSDEEQPVVDDTAKSDSLVCACGADWYATINRVRFCKSCWDALERNIHFKSVVQGDKEGGT